MTRGTLKGAVGLVVLAALLIVPASAGAINPVSFSQGPTMAKHRDGAGAALLPDGRVLVVGGYDNGTYLDSTEIYDPGTNSFSPGPTMPSKLYAPAVASLPDGRVLIAGGYNGDLSSDTPTARVFTPQTGTLSLVGRMIKPTELAGVAPLPDGRILLVGGYSNADGGLNSTEVFDPASNAFSAGPTYPKSAYGVAAAPITGGRVLTAGGYDSHTGNYLADAFTFAGGMFSPIGSLPSHNYFPASAPLPGGRALLAGGYDDNATDPYLKSALIFDPATDSFGSAGVSNLIHKREEAAAVELKDGRVLVLGGWDGQSLDSTEILSVPSNSFTTRVKGRKVSFSVTNEGVAEVTDVSTQVATTAKKKHPKLVKTNSAHGGPGTIVVKVKLTKAGKARLRQKGKVKVLVTYTPDQGLTATSKVKLRAKKHKKK